MHNVSKFIIELNTLTSTLVLIEVLETQLKLLSLKEKESYYVQCK